MLGGHPLALKLYVEDADVQESNMTIQDFVEEVLLSDYLKNRLNVLMN